MKFNFKNILVYSTYSILILLLLYSFFSLKSSTKKINKDLETIILSVKDENWELSSTLFHKFKENYSEKIKNFSSIIRHDEINKALLSIIEISTNIELKNKDECLNSLNKLHFLIINFYENQIPNLLNVL